MTAIGLPYESTSESQLKGHDIRGKYNGVVYIDNELVQGSIRIDKSGKQGFLVVNTAGKQGTEEGRFPVDGITVERAAELLRAAFGVDVDFEIELIAKW